MQTFEGRFYSGESPQAEQVRIEVDAEKLHIAFFTRPEVIWETWPLASLKMDVASTEFAVYRSEAPRRKLIVRGTSEQLKAAFVDLHLDQAMATRRFRRRWLKIAVASMAFVAVAYFGILSATTWFADWLPRKSEKALLGSYVKLPARTLALPQQIAVNSLLQVIYPVFPLDREFEVTLDVLDIGMINAFALPGGQLYMTCGLIKNSESPEMLLGVLAHEIAHIEYRHNLKAYLRNFMLAPLLMGSGAQEDGIVSVAKVAWASGYSRHDETEADHRAVERLEAAGVNPEGFAQFFAVLQKKHGSGKLEKHLEWIGSHPESSKRQNSVLRQKNAERKYHKLAYSPELWSELQGICAY